MSQGPEFFAEAATGLCLGFVCFHLLWYGIHPHAHVRELMVEETRNGLGLHLLAVKPEQIKNLTRVRFLQRKNSSLIVDSHRPYFLRHRHSKSL